MKNKVVNILIFSLESILIISLIALEYLSGYKAGVMKHIYFKKMEHLSTIYNSTGTMIHSMIILVLFIFLVLKYKDRLNQGYKSGIIRFVVLGGIVVSGMYLPYMKDLNSYTYILMTLESMIGIEFIRLILKDKIQ